MYSRQPKCNIIRHASISFKDLIQQPANVSKTCESISSTPEKALFTSNRHSKPKILYLSINSLLKENKEQHTTHSSLRRQRLKQLSSGYQLRRESLSYINLS